ncbi:MAG TPA: NAD(P)/FAD-dependent oxidoreductase [Burkholderiales bacterium]|nr:NAD(P)/FAD-dependent oxidoreductase [Burkholderiales bacterium]
MPNLHRIVIVGGGAGGLELATRLGDTLCRRGEADVTLVDQFRTHVWKPLLHEIAAGSMNPERDELDYLAQAHWHHFRFQLGRLCGLDRERRVIVVAATSDEDGRELIPKREIPYDTLVIAVGSSTNHFGTPGAEQYAVSLDTAEDAEFFHRHLVNACLRANAQRAPLQPRKLDVAIIGGGATGVELAAELHKSTRELVAYGLDRIDPERDVRLTIIEASPRILTGLPERVARATAKLLDALKVQVLTGEKVTEVAADGVATASGRKIAAELVVWCAGIKAPDFLRDLGGLETNRLNQLAVERTLQTTRDAAIFAFGDCACCPWSGHEQCVPARAQAAHQQARLLDENLRRRLRGEPLGHYVYRDFGSLVSLGEYTTVGNLMGALVGGDLFIEGLFARFMYRLLYRQHLYALHGFAKALFDTLGRLITHRTEPRVKLH